MQSHSSSFVSLAPYPSGTCSFSSSSARSIRSSLPRSSQLPLFREIVVTVAGHSKESEDYVPSTPDPTPEPPFTTWAGSSSECEDIKPEPPLSPSLSSTTQNSGSTVQIDQYLTPLQKGLYRLQPPAVTSARGDRCYIGRPDQFYVGRAHRYIRTKA
ncbi:hypothetical protein PCANC_14703 [Puccinia coronata f. sp. avenae]|uniref:Uncharacterized protein n=1 Tax=Puccinia coronata f. sp. avenae TaxID=200324 RepID=A0A2N5SXV4_9BASI|nr:hypothetical protein PCANC_14703 [Puccinia coronata f. sp. avenae]